MDARPAVCEIYRTAIPMRGFEHASASRDVAEAVVVRVAFDDGGEGWGEALPRPYVTGETPDTVIRDLSELLWPAWRQVPLDADILTRAAAMDVPPGDGHCMNAAVCAIESAFLWRSFGSIAPAGRIAGRVSGVLGSADPARTGRALRLMRWFGLRDFKLKLGLGDDVDEENLRVVGRRIGKAVARGRCTLRVDVNGGWSAEETPQRVSALEPFGVCVVEQPTRCPAAQLAELARRCRLPLMADESLLGDADAAALLPAGSAVWWNIRLSKNGGLLRSFALARMAHETGVPFVVGCMVGESSILSAAQRVMLRMGPPPRFIEGNYGRFLLSDDLAARPLRFGYGGRLKSLGCSEVRIDRRKLGRFGALVATLKA